MKGIHDMSILLAILVAATLVDGATNGRLDTPWFCREGECPRFTERAVTRNGVELRVRDYESAYWVTTNASGNGFWTLFNYIDGQTNNVDSQKISMTAPVINVVRLSTSGTVAPESTPTSVKFLNGAVSTNQCKEGYERITNACQCRAAAVQMGHSVGGGGYSFEGSWDILGCYYYAGGPWKGNSYFSNAGTSTANPGLGNSPDRALLCQPAGAAAPPCERKPTTESFYLPAKYQNEKGPPEPTPGSGAYLEKVPAKTYVVKTYSGMNTNTSKLQHMEQLYADMASFGLEAGVDYSTDEYVTAGYDSPWIQASQRHNEVWVEIKSLDGTDKLNVVGRWIDITDPNGATMLDENGEPMTCEGEECTKTQTMSREDAEENPASRLVLSAVAVLVLLFQC